ncbi:unnamed protein product [Rotaria sp. Silwood1]|nr:unnamed protein product [Rotaria sp. Silwood1]
MYRSLYWPIIKLQFRCVVAIFSNHISIPLQQICFNMEHHIQDQQFRSQFDLPKEILSTNTNDTTIPTQNQTELIVDEMNSICKEVNNDRSIADAIFRSLNESKWTFERILKGKPCDGIVHGQAQFNISQSNELIYKEQGKLILSSEKQFDITQKYIYVYNKNEDVINVYFVDNNTNKRSLIFHTIYFQSKNFLSNEWIANGQHLCNQDYYFVSYLFVFNQINLSRFEIIYTVKGPTKDYISKTIFQPLKN